MLWQTIKSDWKVNSQMKGRFVVAMFRVAHATTCWPKALKPVAWLLQFGYRILVDWIMGIDLPVQVVAGPRLRLYHGVGLVINYQTRLGSDCILRHGVTIGSKIIDGKDTLAPVIGDCVEFGAGSAVIGEVSVGNHAVIGVNAVVTKDAPTYAVMVGCPARNIREKVAHASNEQ